ncbi:MAG: helix-turn-helix transcriptional regulator [Bacteroidales bacterium]|jgi:transcriptional regulator with XRE-family HTH domain|nr:helix-turn-helix domain-containing protein [Synergistaceae bacterium]MDD2330916.1 helix-turn-helix transcriptional regulator [Bacteroidales bacterium]MDD3333669.1 helix-turn-helix transcriptional regulator [Proteiniphilum sp.]MDD5346180.1 helix-turn-helix transcriptional regulator [Proteiniphilum sp.]MDD5620642.1 helix-turn-helix transcriptional regulator [Proteiniphilum sp.]
MKKNAILESIRQKTPAYIKREIDLSFFIVDRISEILQSKGMTQKDLADLLGKKESEISKWMTGTHNFTIRSIAKIESALDVSIFDIEKKQPDSEVHKANTSDFLTILLKDRHSQKHNPIIKRNLDLTLMSQ